MFYQERNILLGATVVLFSLSCTLIQGASVSHQVYSPAFRHPPSKAAEGVKKAAEILERPIAERVEWLFSLADTHAREYSSPEAWLARQRYLAIHPTCILAFKCMDGRVNLGDATGTPTGIIQLYRNIGGMFDLGWPHFSDSLVDTVGRAVRMGQQTLMLITYHYSKGDPHRGCAGFGYDTDAARAYAFQIKHQVEEVFGAVHGTVYPLVCGFETDDDTLVLHASDAAGSGSDLVLDLSELADADAE
eukprot:CAMPEP_0172189556 /NCGR_PEP_ID=MMETSP1050-20130122/22591_1 /TAXON_ID=233186 /ORGANISM="Cryptomonas curvata, Strain CCAP979/52" /LENGTH=246 /DNA_ID=CAMNT_0012864267 /DNA_START=161 /DNA_END=898 /DNA_ORIENTATION=+